MDEKSQILKEELSELRQLRAEIQAGASSLSKESETDKRDLKDFYGVLKKFEKKAEGLPTFVKKDLRSGLKEHLTILSDHAAREAKKAFSNEVQVLNRVAARAEKAFDRLAPRVGWRGYLIPLSGCVISFLASCGVAWWMQYGMVKIDSETIRILRNGNYLENAMAGLEESENKKLQTLMKKGWLSYKEKYSL